MTPDRSFSICDSLAVNPAKHCASLVIVENLGEDSNGCPRIARPSEGLRSGTVTFVKTNDRVYGITCWHVIESFRKELEISGNPNSHTLRTMKNGFYVILDRFVQPIPQFGLDNIDVGIRELDPELVTTIGKEPMNLDEQPEAPHDIGFGYAVGFPETMKMKKKVDNLGYKIFMPQVHILAERKELPDRRFALFSELNGKPVQTDFSGMSGGPIYWSTEDHYGIFGIIYEGGIGSGFSEGRSIYVYGEYATPEVIKGWISQLPTT